MDADRNSRGVKRVRQACLNCRRKKARCPGERPMCSFCVRLRQQCVYRETSKAADASSYPTDPEEIRALVSRISTIESALSAFPGTSDASTHPSNGRLNSPNALASNYATHFQAQQDPTTCLNELRYYAQSPTWDASQDDLPPPGPLNAAVDDFFKYSHNQPYSFFHENNFRQRLAEGILPDFLIFSVLASSLRFSSHSFWEGNQTAAADAYARRSWRSLASQFLEGEEDPDVRVVQATTLLAIYDFIVGRHRGAWVKVGLAARIGQDLRLMFEPPDSLSFADQEENRRAYWSVYLLDSLITCGRGRPPAIHEYNCTVQLPCDEINFRTSQWQKTDTLEYFTSNHRLQGKDPGPFARVIIVASVLTRCAQYMVQAYNVKSESPPWDSTSDFATIFSTLLYLETRLQFRRPVGEAVSQRCTIDGRIDHHSAEPLVFSYELYHLCHCLLQHHFLLRLRLSSIQAEVPEIFLRRALEMCRDHAQASTRVLREARDVGCMVLSSFLGYCFLVSATINALYTHSEDAMVRQESYESLQFNKSFLEGHTKYWPNSIRMAAALNQFCLDSALYKSLISPTVKAMEFDPRETEILYSLADYSTMSNTQTAARGPAISTPSNSDSHSPNWFDGSDYPVTGADNVQMRAVQQHHMLQQSFFDNTDDFQRVSGFLSGSNGALGPMDDGMGAEYETFS